MKNIWNEIAFRLLLWVCQLAGLLPYWFLYGVMVPVVYFLMYKIVGYRTKVVRGNLQSAFPEKTEKERREIERKFYTHLSELFVDTLDISSMSKKRIRKRFSYLNAEEQEARMAGKSWIAATAHYGCWEYTPNYALFTDAQVSGVYHKLHSAVFDRFYLHIRSRFGAVPIERDEVAREMVRVRTENRRIVLALIADQSPVVYSIQHWFEFLNHPTAFFMGMEKIALKFKIPVYFMHIEKIKRGYYTAWFEEIYDGEEKLEDLEITRRYVAKLEAMIRRRPELWLWSHRRWKHTPESVAREKERHFRR